MAVSLKHSFQSAKADGADSTLVQPSSWNAEHTLTLATNKLLGRSTAGTGAAEEISIGTNLTLSSGTLSAASQVYPGAGIPNSTGSAWGTSYSTSGSGTVVVLGTSPTITNATLAGTSALLAASIPNIAETATVSATAATGTINYDVSTQSVLYYTTNASANWTLNVRMSSGTSLNTAMATGQSLTIAFLVTQGSTAYYNNVFQIDGSAVTPKWQGGTAPSSGNASSVDVYTYTIIKTGSAAFTVLASQTKFA